MRGIKQHTNFIILTALILLGIGAYLVISRKVPVSVLAVLPIPILRVVAIPATMQLSMPFTSQAPAGNWSEPWQSACEETDIVMVDNYYRKQTLTSVKAIVEITGILNVKDQAIGKSSNESLETIIAIIQAAKLSWHARVVVDPTLKEMQDELVQGRPIIVPVDARQLTNPFYANISPEYHVIVISGYDDPLKQFIVQDPGTDKGANYRYSYTELMTAIHNYVQPDIRQGPKAVLFTSL